MVFLDANMRLGRGLVPARFDTDGPEGALDMLNFFGIEKALVRLERQENWSAREGNAEVVSYCREQVLSERLLPVWNLLPHITGDFPPPHKLPRAMAEAGVRALCALKGIQFPLDEPIFSGDSLASLEEKGIPLLYPMEREEEFISLAGILREFPRLVLVACLDKPAWGTDRYTWPLFEKFPRFRLCPSGYHISGSLQETVKRFGPEVLIFGSGYPLLNPGGAVEFLGRLDLEDREKELIGSINMTRLLDWERNL